MPKDGSSPSLDVLLIQKLRAEIAGLKQENEDLSSINAMLKKGMERHSNCPSCKAREPQLRPKGEKGCGWEPDD